MNKTNLLIDLGIFITYLIADEPNFTGVPIHEWLSVGVALVVIVHLLLHWKWIVSVGGQYFRKLFHTSRLKFFVDSLLFIVFIGIMLSGLLISRSFFPAFGLNIEAGRNWEMLHKVLPTLGILLVGLHFALNWSWVVAMTKRYILHPFSGLFRRPVQPAVVTVDVRDDRPTGLK